MRADLLAFPPTRIIRRRPMKSRKHIVVAKKRSPALILWAGLVMMVRYTVPAAVYVLAGGTVFRWLGL